MKIKKIDIKPNTELITISVVENSVFKIGNLVIVNVRINTNSDIPASSVIATGMPIPIYLPNTNGTASVSFEEKVTISNTGELKNSIIIKKGALFVDFCYIAASE